MKLVRYNSLNDFIPSTFGSLLENVLRNENDDKNTESFFPATDIVKNGNEFVLHLIAPGMSKSDFDIDVQENELTIKGERRKDEKLTYTNIESRFGSFSRTFSLNDNIIKDSIKATYENGVLQIVLPIDKKKLERKAIEVK
jgi:HSP20 family protein